MKKIISLVLVAALMLTALFAFTSCSKEDNVLTCGVTIFENMNEKDENGNWTGFESEFAMEVGKILGMEVEFQIIDWGQKYNELNSGKIDCIWNGFTANSSDEVGGVKVKREELVDFSYTYMLNQQCVVINKKDAETIKTVEDLAGKKAAVEAGSAGAAYAKDATGSADNLVTFTAQNSTFMEVKTGKSDIAVVDILLAQNICGKGDYEDLMIVDTITLDAEYYAIGFKKGSELKDKVNAAIKTLNENGKLLELAKKYGLENSLKVEY